MLIGGGIEGTKLSVDCATGFAVDLLLQYTIEYALAQFRGQSTADLASKISLPSAISACAANVIGPCGVKCQAALTGATGLLDNIVKQYQTKGITHIDYIAAVETGAFQAMIGALIAKGVPYVASRFKATGKEVEDAIEAVNNSLTKRFVAKSGQELADYLSKLTQKPAGISYSGKMFRYIPSQYTDAKLIVQTITSDVLNRFRTGLYLSETKAGNMIEATFYDGISGKQLYEFSDIQVNNLLDVTDQKTVEMLGTTIESMKLTSGDNKYDFTQEVATWARNNGYSGIKFYGTQGGSTVYINFVLFDQAIVDKSIKGAINPISW